MASGLLSSRFQKPPEGITQLQVGHLSVHVSVLQSRIPSLSLANFLALYRGHVGAFLHVRDGYLVDQMRWHQAEGREPLEPGLNLRRDGEGEKTQKL